MRVIAFWCAAVIAALTIGLGLASLIEGDPAPASRVWLEPMAPPLPPANSNRPLTPEQAAAANAAIASSTEPLEAARPFLMPANVAGELSRRTALDCLTAAIYYEAVSESPQGQRAVAQVVLNRVRHPAFPNSVCGVVYQGSERSTGCQFSFTCDGSLARRPSRAGWDRAAGFAAAALSGMVEPSVGTATHYHTVSVLPYWADSLTKLTTVGAHIFYRWRGYWGKRAAFTDSYGGEPQEAASVAADLLAVGPESTVVDPLAAAAAPLTRLLADEQTGQLALPGGPAREPASVAADSRAGKPIADESRGVLRSEDPEGKGE